MLHRRSWEVVLQVAKLKGFMSGDVSATNPSSPQIAKNHWARRVF
jgi:hypothetical protein